MPKTLPSHRRWLAREFPGLDDVLLACTGPEQMHAVVADAGAAHGGSTGAAIRTAARLQLHRIPNRTSHRQALAHRAVLRDAGRGQW